MIDDFHILVVEDDAILRKVIASLFAKFASVTEAESGHHAIAHLKSSRADLIFTDISMPNGSGTELLQWVLAAHDVPPPTVLVTGELHMSQDQAIVLGAHALVSKPFKMRDLVLIAQKIKADLDDGSRMRSSLAT